MDKLPRYLGAVICINVDTKEDYHAFIYTKEKGSHEYELNKERTGYDLLRDYQSEEYRCNFEEVEIKYYDICTNAISLTEQAVVLQQLAKINDINIDIEQLNRSIDKGKARHK
jgi:hypothetical protein